MLMTMIMMISDTDQQARFMAIYHTYQSAMRKYACKLLAENCGQAEDVVQDAFLSIVRNMDTVAGLNENAVRVYVMKAVKTAAFACLQRESGHDALKTKIQETYDTAPDKYRDATLDEVCTRENMQLLLELLRRLPEVYRDILELYYLSGLELKTIARQFGLSYDTVKKRYRRGCRLLADGLKKGGVTYGNRHDE